MNLLKNKSVWYKFKWYGGKFVEYKKEEDTKYKKMKNNEADLFLKKLFQHRNRKFIKQNSIEINLI